jgi:fructose-1,6-bisphosphatase
VAGGAASNGREKILQLDPHSLHERTPFFAGSINMMGSFLAP